jgi:hypothetical protein
VPAPLNSVTEYGCARPRGCPTVEYMAGRKFETECGGPTNIGRWDADADTAALVAVVERHLRIMADSIESVFTGRNVS